MVRNIVSNRSASCCASGADTIRSVPIQPRSAPAQNVGPLPVRTITRTEWSCPNVSKASQTSATMRASNAFRRSGRFKVTLAPPSYNSTRIDVGCFIRASHSKNREVRRADRRRHRDVKTQTENLPCSHRIDDPIIPETSGAEIRTALLLILGSYRLHDPSLLTLRQGSFVAGSLLLFHRQEYLCRLLRPHH